MAHTIRKDAATTTILNDVHVAFSRCRDRGGNWAEEGKRWLGDVVVLADRIATELPTTENAVTDAVAARDASLVAAKACVGASYDGLWNLCGRPASDPWLAILFPGGADCADGKIEDRPRVMDVVAESLETLGHPRIPAATCAEVAIQIKAQAKDLREKIEAAAKATARQAVKGQVRKALGLVGQAQLVSLKRALTNHRFREAEIGEVIPNRPPRAKAKAPPAVAPTEPADAAPADADASDDASEPDAE